MSKVIKSNRLIFDTPIKLVQTAIIDSESADDTKDIVAETEKIVRELLEQAEVRAGAIIKEAKDEAEAIRRKVLAEADDLKASAIKEGFNEGLVNGKKQVEAEKQQVLSEANGLLAEAIEKKNNYMAEVKEEIIELAIGIAEKLIYQQLTLAPTSILPIVKAMLDEAKPDHHSSIIIYVSSEVKEELIMELEKKQLWPVDKLSIEIDCDLAKGDCILATSTGTYKLKIAESIEKIKDILIGADINE
ncbi:MAG: FliH/SctL family protein [Bacillota bacterium]|nr:FliH/SctL family protein [Bacillota bacterium]